MATLRSYDYLHITWDIVDALYELSTLGIRITNRAITRRYANKHGQKDIVEFIDKVSYYSNARHVWQHIICDIENGFEMPYIDEVKS